MQSVMADILNDVYEPRFLNCSYGFRPGRSAHDVVKGIYQAVTTRPVNCVLEADIKGFFDNLDQKWLIKFLEHDIADKNFIRYIVRFLKAGVMEGTELKDSDAGTPQGGLISPVLANVYLHYVLDLWIERCVKPRMRGDVYYFRYADDFVLLFKIETEANLVLKLLRERLSKFGLQLAEDKTRILTIGRHDKKKGNFDFLGFNFFNVKSHIGHYRLGVRSCEKKLKVKRQELKSWLWTRLMEPVAETFQALNRKLVGHFNYYGVSGNSRALSKFAWYAAKATMRMLRRRGQKHRIGWTKFLELWKKFVKPAHITTDIWSAPSMLI